MQTPEKNAVSNTAIGAQPSQHQHDPEPERSRSSSLQERKHPLSVNVGDGWTTSPGGWDTPNKKIIADVSRMSPRQTEVPDNFRHGEFDAILVPAGGTRDDGLPHVWVQERLLFAASIYKDYMKQGFPLRVLCLGGGTYHKPNYTNDAGFPVHESTSCAEFLVEQGVAPEHIHKEWSSYDTIANAWFARREHTDPLEMNRLLIVTSKFHLARTRAIFEWVYSLKPLTVEYKLTFFGVRDVGFDDEKVLESRYEREGKSLEGLLKTRQGIESLKEFHGWFYTVHKAYCVGGYNEPRQVADAKAMKSY